MSRAVPNWEGKTDDTKVPARVKLRVFLGCSGKCYHCGRVLRPGDDWALDHIVALINGGKHEEKNLAPICEPCHTLKTAKDVEEKAATYKTRLKHYGLKESKTPMPYGKKSKWKRKMNGKVVLR
jgi:5-methylcytosine-specific restriction protein A